MENISELLKKPVAIKSDSVFTHMSNFVYNRMSKYYGESCRFSVKFKYFESIDVSKATKANTNISIEKKAKSLKATLINKKRTHSKVTCTHHVVYNYIPFEIMLSLWSLFLPFVIVVVVVVVVVVGCV